MDAGQKALNHEEHEGHEAGERDFDSQPGMRVNPALREQEMFFVLFVSFVVRSS